MQNEIIALDTAEARPIYVGESTTAEKNWKAVYNLDLNKVASIAGKDYKIIQHRDVVNSFTEACNNLNLKNQIKINNARNRIFVDVTFPDSKLYVDVGEDFIIGFRLINSYDKTTGIMILPRLVRLACSNGMVIQSKNFVASYNYRHNQKMAEHFEGYIEKALKETIESSDKLKAMVNDCIGDSVEWKLAEQILTKLIMVKKHFEKIKDILQDKYDKVGGITRWDLYNAITRYCTHDEQLKPNVEMVLQRKAQTVLEKPIETLATIYGDS